MSAADRWGAAARDRDQVQASRELAEDVKLYNPMTAEPLVGRQAVAGAMAALNDLFDDFEHLHVLVDPSTRQESAGEIQAFVFRARIGDHVLEGIDLLEVNDRDKIATITVLARPLAALQALGQALAEHRTARPADR